VWITSYQGRQRGGLARPGRACDQDQAARLGGQALQDYGDAQFCKRLPGFAQHPDRHREGAPLPICVDAETPKPVVAECEVGLVRLLERDLQVIGQHGRQHAFDVIRRQRRSVGACQAAVDAQDRGASRPQMQVGSTGTVCPVQQDVEFG